MPGCFFDYGFDQERARIIDQDLCPDAETQREEDRDGRQAKSKDVYETKTAGKNKSGKGKG
jgi:hypothetical protein